MPITERTLKRWRKEALKEESEYCPESHFKIDVAFYKEIQKRILRMTQEILDQHLLRKK